MCWRSTSTGWVVVFACLPGTRYLFLLLSDVLFLPGVTILMSFLIVNLSCFLYCFRSSSNKIIASSATTAVCISTRVLVFRLHWTCDFPRALEPFFVEWSCPITWRRGAVVWSYVTKCRGEEGAGSFFFFHFGLRRQLQTPYCGVFTVPLLNLVSAIISLCGVNTAPRHSETKKRRTLGTPLVLLHSKNWQKIGGITCKIQEEIRASSSLSRVMLCTEASTISRRYCSIEKYAASCYKKSKKKVYIYVYICIKRRNEISQEQAQLLS